ncbi:pantoate--beta-alanine ligase [Streptomyces sp. NBC_01808]|uniref:pantoate--beta-alanine ligase n=1 Tax=Streptomyces sp. NBC_01808 TaxID=2975947 RepID=UPI002DD92505|nr:pantoate--beta-alanine ligase [Streptomyces sp. NBC_01808]WSA39425.1 pantoate--beta-alanine ligase [Streptomyces sp. NBC_01808]
MTALLVHQAAELPEPPGAHEPPEAPGAAPERPARAVVMTMGALHEGHAALVRAARAEVGPHGQVVVTVFVNPLQFGPGEDLDRYPRTLDADVLLAGKEGADVVYAPSADEVYPGGEPQVRVSAGPMGERLEGAFRPGHFDGVLTVVAKLLHLTRPDMALYGQKDAQQLALITRMVRDLNFPVRILGVPTVREPDGLALSSRNVYLSAPERRTALALSRALFAARAAAGAAGTPSEALTAAQSVLHDAGALTPPLELDYAALVDPADFTPVTDAMARTPQDPDGTPQKPDGTPLKDGTAHETVLAVAARVGATRLIDNVRLTFGGAR